MKRKFIKTLSAALAVSTLATSAFAQTHTVKKGDTLWKIAVKYDKNITEIIKANPGIKNYSLIYPGQKITIPESTSDTSSVSAYEKEVVRLVNEERAKNGLKALTIDYDLCRVARVKSQDMKNNNYFAHQSPTYGSPFDMMERFGISYRSAAENIAKGQTSPKAVVNAWMNSSGHRKNILSPSYTHIGVGHVASGNYWTQMFVGR